MLNVRRMALLREVAAAGSISQAAKRLNLTPSAVSQQLTQLEREIGVDLVLRHPRSVELTAAGQRLADHTDAILAQLADVHSDVLTVALGNERPVRVGAFSSAASTIVADALEILRDGTSVALVLRELDPEAAIAALKVGDLDLAVIWQYDYVPLSDVESVEIVHLFNDTIDVILPRDHPLAGESVIELSELEDVPWIASTKPSSCQPFTRRACQAAGFTPKVVAESNDHHAVQELVAQGTGAAFVGRLSLHRHHPDVAIVQLATPLQRKVGIAWRRDRELTVPVKSALEILRRVGTRRRGAVAA